MAYKMKGSPFQRNFPNDIKKPAPTKWINFVIQGISAIASAAKKDKEQRKAATDKALEASKAKGEVQDEEAAKAGEGPKPTEVADATKVEKFKAAEKPTA